MKDWKNRIADRKGEPSRFGWLQNKCTKSATNYMVIYTNGESCSWCVKKSADFVGVRPVFKIKLKNK